MRTQQRRCKCKINSIKINFCVPKQQVGRRKKFIIDFFFLLKRENELKSLSNFYDFSSKKSNYESLLFRLLRWKRRKKENKIKEFFSQLSNWKLLLYFMLLIMRKMYWLVCVFNPRMIIATVTALLRIHWNHEIYLKFMLLQYCENTLKVSSWEKREKAALFTAQILRVPSTAIYFYD